MPKIERELCCLSKMTAQKDLSATQLLCNKANYLLLHITGGEMSVSSGVGCPTLLQNGTSDPRVA